MSIASTGLGKDEQRLITRQTYRLDEVAKLLGIGRNKAYEAAQQADCPFPVIRIGKRIVVPRVAIDRLLGISE